MNASYDAVDVVDSTEAEVACLMVGGSLFRSLGLGLRREIGGGGGGGFRADAVTGVDW